MATIPSYLSWVPKTGTGNAQIKINSVSPYTGRTDRSTKVPGKIVGKSNAVTVTVLEKAADEFITPDGLITINVAKGGETIHVTGKSNSKLLTFTWKTNFGIANVRSLRLMVVQLLRLVLLLLVTPVLLENILMMLLLLYRRMKLLKFVLQLLKLRVKVRLLLKLLLLLRLLVTVICISIRRVQLLQLLLFRRVVVSRL